MMVCGPFSQSSASPPSPPERRRAAALDRRHHLQLLEADVAGIGGTPGSPVVAKDIRDLQLGTQHCRGWLGWRLNFLAVAPPGFRGPLLYAGQLVERALDGGDHAGGARRKRG